MRAGFPLTPDIVARYFTGRRPADMFAEVEIAAGRKLPADFAATVAARDAAPLPRASCARPAHAAYALSWLRGPKCVASSSSLERIRVSLESTDLMRFFEPICFPPTTCRTASRRRTCSCMPPRMMRVQPGDCIVVEDSPVGVAAGVAAGMTAIGFVGGSHAGSQLGDILAPPAPAR